MVAQGQALWDGGASPARAPALPLSLGYEARTFEPAGPLTERGGAAVDRGSAGRTQFAAASTSARTFLLGTNPPRPRRLTGPGPGHRAARRISSSDSCLTSFLRRALYLCKNNGRPAATVAVAVPVRRPDQAWLPGPLPRAAQQSSQGVSNGGRPPCR